jgi:hypothetical protein
VGDEAGDECNQPEFEARTTSRLLTGDDSNQTVISNRSKSGGTLSRKGITQTAVISDQGHGHGFLIRIFNEGGSQAMDPVRTPKGIRWKEACELADQLLLTGLPPETTNAPYRVALQAQIGRVP